MQSTAALNIPAVAAAPASGVCVSNAAGNPYNMNSGYGEEMNCQLRFKAIF
jgi:hypothetical protein